MTKIMCVLVVAILLPLKTLAKDLGKVSNVFHIEEEGFTAMMQRKLAEIDMNAERQKMQRIAKDRIENPRAVEGIKPATSYRNFYFDPTYTLDKDAVLPCGKILHKAGTKVNPLEHMQLNRRIFFVDARERNQVEWLVEQLNNPLLEQKVPVEDRVILVGGNVFKLRDELAKMQEQEVFFDQHGELTTKFGIKASPAIAMQEGVRLRIDEINLGDS